MPFYRKKKLYFLFLIPFFFLFSIFYLCIPFCLAAISTVVGLLLPSPSTHTAARTTPACITLWASPTHIHYHSVILPRSHRPHPPVLVVRLVLGLNPSHDPPDPPPSSIPLPPSIRRQLPHRCAFLSLSFLLRSCSCQLSVSGFNSPNTVFSAGGMFLAA